jgi:hypothetical protein
LDIDRTFDWLIGDSVAEVFGWLAGVGEPSQRDSTNSIKIVATRAGARRRAGWPDCNLGVDNIFSNRSDSARRHFIYRFVTDRN